MDTKELLESLNEDYTLRNSLRRKSYTVDDKLVAEIENLEKQYINGYIIPQMKSWAMDLLKELQCEVNLCILKDANGDVRVEDELPSHDNLWPEMLDTKEYLEEIPIEPDVDTDVVEVIESETTEEPEETIAAEIRATSADPIEDEAEDIPDDGLEIDDVESEATADKDDKKGDKPGEIELALDADTDDLPNDFDEPIRNKMCDREMRKKYRGALLGQDIPQNKVLQIMRKIAYLCDNYIKHADRFYRSYESITKADEMRELLMNVGERLAGGKNKDAHAYCLHFLQFIQKEMAGKNTGPLGKITKKNYTCKIMFADGRTREYQLNEAIREMVKMIGPAKVAMSHAYIKSGGCSICMQTKHTTQFKAGAFVAIDDVYSVSTLGQQKDKRSVLLRLKALCKEIVNIEF